MRTTQYNSNNSVTPEFKWTSFEKEYNLDKLINITFKAEERFVIQISFRTVVYKGQNYPRYCRVSVE